MTRLIVLVGFVIAFAAGVTVGISLPRWSSTPPLRPGGGPRGWMAQQLQLSADQQKQLAAIWSELARGGPHQQGDGRRQLRRDRDAAIANLIREEDRPAYEAVLRDYEEKSAAMDAEWRQRYRSAVERTKAMLTEEQRRKYDALLSRQGWGPPGGEDRGRGMSTRPDGGRYSTTNRGNVPSN